MKHVFLVLAGVGVACAAIASSAFAADNGPCVSVHVSGSDGSSYDDSLYDCPDTGIGGVTPGGGPSGPGGGTGGGGNGGGRGPGGGGGVAKGGPQKKPGTKPPAPPVDPCHGPRNTQPAACQKQTPNVFPDVDCNGRNPQLVVGPKRGFDSLQCGGRWFCKPADEIGDGPADAILFGYEALGKAQFEQLMRALLRAQRSGGAVYACVRIAR